MPNGKKKTYSVLEQLSTQELENLLVQDFSASNGAEPDIDFILEVMEVIQRRDDSDAVGMEDLDVDKAWKEFRQEYQGHSESFKVGSSREYSPSQPEQIRKPKRVYPLIRYAGIAAILIILLSGVASALGYNVFQAIATWTTETFSFVSPGNAEAQNSRQAVPENDLGSSLRTIVAEQTETPLVPTWFPEGTEEYEPVSIVDRVTRTIFSESFKTASGSFTIQIQIYDTFPEHFAGVYQKDDSPVKLREINGITHYIFSNSKTHQAVWMNGNIEVAISGKLSVEELEKMVESIYEE